MIMKVVRNKELKEDIKAILENGKESLYFLKSSYKEIVDLLEESILKNNK